ncbi:threonine/serine exporter family protein [Lacicoccus alkaliphilus]|nr:threonine/serine exporter family protein [Salinicoccus alkaliphilus]
MTDLYETEEKIKDVVMLAARILLEAGAEGTRVEDTMTYISSALGYKGSNSFVTNTVVTYLLHNGTHPRIYRIQTRDTNLIRISETNRVSRHIVSGELSLDEAWEKLNYIDEAIDDHPLPFKALAGGMVGLSFLYLQGGMMIDVPTAILAGGIGYFVTEYISKKVETQFIPEFIGSFIIALLAAFGHMLIPGGELSVIIISAVMPIVPGVLITNAIQDLFGGHMLMSITKLLEALVTSFGIGAGVATVLIFL